MKKYKDLILDLDGTLIDSKKDIADATNATLKHIGTAAISDDAVYSFVGRGVMDLIRNAVPGKGENEIKEAFRFFSDYYLAHCLETTVLFSGVEDVLQEMKDQGVKLSVLTNKPQNYTHVILRGLGIESLFSVISAATPGVVHKPDRDVTLAVLTAMKTKPEDTLMVGDSVVDLQTAENAGLDCALALYGFSPREEILSYQSRTQIILNRFDELKGYV